MVVVTLTLGVFQKDFDFFTFHPKVFHKFTFNPELFIFLLLTQNFLSFAIYSHNFFLLSTLSFIVSSFRKFFALCFVLNFVT
ncbi:hypothetical protein HanRHA438_Chr11g0529061 [Helianthus annuus]|nr:hypothetical protein HanRHA438_Chr11g0529061 [Helianthus annuus]